MIYQLSLAEHCVNTVEQALTAIEHHYSAIPMLISLVLLFHSPSDLCVSKTANYKIDVERCAEFLCVVPLPVFVMNTIYPEK